MTGIDPRGFATVIEYTDAMAYLVEDISPTEKLEDPEQWQEWAANLLADPSFFGQATPDPYLFTDWREWAMRLNQSVNFTG